MKMCNKALYLWIFSHFWLSYELLKQVSGKFTLKYDFPKHFRQNNVNVKCINSIQYRHFFMYWNECIESWGSGRHSKRENWLFIRSRCTAVYSFLLQREKNIKRGTRCSWRFFMCLFSIVICVCIWNKGTVNTFPHFQFPTREKIPHW